MTLAPGALHDTRRVTRVRRSCTPAALPVTMCTARQPRWHRQAARRALSALLSTPLAATHGTGASSEISRSVQQPPNIEARRCMLLRCMSRAHEIRRHQVHAMLWDGRQEGLAAAREWPFIRLPRRMVPKMRVDRAPSTFVSFFLFSLAFRTKRVRTLTATALACPIELGPFRVHAPMWSQCTIFSAPTWSNVRSLQRCTRVDLTPIRRQ